MKKKNSTPKELLKFIAAAGGIFILSTLNPTLPHRLLSAYFQRKRFLRSLFLKDLRRLQERKLLDFTEAEDGLIKITLKRRGRKVALAYRLDEMKIVRPKTWGGRWWLVMFDIPHAKKVARDALRAKLQEMGFYALQKSVFISPYPCEDEIDFLGEVFDVRQHILVISTNDFEGSEKLKHHYGLA